MNQYLARYAEPQVQWLAGLVTGPFQHCVVIPAYDETPAFAERLMQSPLWAQNLLAVVVINQPQHLPQATPQNLALLNYFAQLPLSWQCQYLALYQSPNHSAWLVVDACALDKQGVGWARKLGCDLAVALWQQGIIQSPWLHSTDCDAHLPERYFDLPVSKHTVAACYDFNHIATEEDTELLEATQAYQAAIKYYAKGLAWAGSGYGFTALGSTLAVTFAGYCHVRGFPQKDAGEDFYLLNKLAKLGDICHPGITVELAARTSHRVPFGTGPAVAKILTLQQQGKTYDYYNPVCFRELRICLNQLTELWQNAAQLDAMTAPSQAALAAMGIDTLQQHLRKQVRTEQQAQRALHHWFDGFKTLKFIHHLQAHYYPPLPLTQCLAEAPYQC